MRNQRNKPSSQVNRLNCSEPLDAQQCRWSYIHRVSKGTLPPKPCYNSPACKLHPVKLATLHKACCACVSLASLSHFPKQQMKLPIVTICIIILVNLLITEVKITAFTIYALLYKCHPCLWKRATDRLTYKDKQKNYLPYWNILRTFIQPTEKLVLN